MSIHPSVLKQLLQLQMLQSVDSLTGTASSSSESDYGTDFADLLQLLLSGDTSLEASSDKIIPAAELLAQSKWSASPFLSGAWSSLEAYETPDDYESYIQGASSRNGVEASLVKAVIQAESGYNSQAVSSAGAKGLMQLMDATGQGLGVTNPFDPQQNIEGGTRFLSNLLSKYNGNEAVALAAYNAGPGRVDRLGISNDAELQEKLSLLPQETQKYVSKVLGLKQQYEAQA